MKDEELFKLLPKETRNAAIEAKIKMASLIQQNEEAKISEKTPKSGVSEEPKSSQIPEPEKMNVEIESKIYEIEEKIIATNLDGFQKLDQDGEILRDSTSLENRSEKPAMPSPNSKIEALKTKRDKVQLEVEEIYQDYKKASRHLKNQKLQMKQNETNMQNFLVEKEEKEKVLEKRLKIMELMPQGEENLLKLREIVAKKKAKILGLQEQFELHKKSLLEDRERMKIEIKNLSEKQILEEEEETLKQKILKAQNQLEKQKKYGLQLAKQMEKIPQEYVPR